MTSGLFLVHRPFYGARVHCWAVYNRVAAFFTSRHTTSYACSLLCCVAEPKFSGEEYFGTYVDLNEFYNRHCNIKAFPSRLKKDGQSRVIDYKTFLRTFSYYFHHIKKAAKGPAYRKYVHWGIYALFKISCTEQFSLSSSWRCRIVVCLPQLIILCLWYKSCCVFVRYFGACVRRYGREKDFWVHRQQVLSLIHSVYPRTTHWQYSPCYGLLCSFYSGSWKIFLFIYLDSTKGSTLCSLFKRCVLLVDTPPSVFCKGGASCRYVCEMWAF